MYVQSCEVYDTKTDQWTLVTQLTRAASCQPHVIIDYASEFVHSNEPAETDIQMQVLLFGGHLFSNDSDHHSLQRVTLGSSGSWRVEDRPVSLMTHGVLYHTATRASVPVHYLRQFD